MSARYPLEALLRPAVEWNSAVAAWSAAALCALAPSFWLLTPPVARGSALLLALFGAWRAWQAGRILRYRRALRTASAYVLPARRLPAATAGLLLGRGFRWTGIHTQRLWEATRPEVQRLLEPSRLYRLARDLEVGRPRWQRRLAGAWNPWRPAPPVGGLPALHGVGWPEGERDLRLSAADREGHVFVLGTTGVGKTRLAELCLVQDIRAGAPVVVFDPKGDAALFRRVRREAIRAGRDWFFFHLGYPDQSCAYNPIGRFERVSEVPTRLANALPGTGNAAAFREFAWLFAHVIARALVALGEQPTYQGVLRAMSDIDPLLVRYFEHWLEREGPADWCAAVAVDDGRRIAAHLRDRDARAIALVRYVRARDLYDPVADGLRRAWEYEKTYFDKISVAIQPLLEKLLSGPLAALLSPDPTAPAARPRLDWPTVFRRRAVVYIGTDALTDPMIAGVVNQTLLADLVAYAGHLYKHGAGYGLPGRPAGPPEALVHIDEFAEVARGPEIVQALNKGRGAGLRLQVYAQTLADLEVGFGDAARARQVVGNVSNTLIVLRVADRDTARLLTDRLEQTEITGRVLDSGATDSADPTSPVDFVSSTRERFAIQRVALLEPAQVMALPKGQAFVLSGGNQLAKLRIPLLAEPGALTADDEGLAREMVRRQTGGAARPRPVRQAALALTPEEAP